MMLAVEDIPDAVLQAAVNAFDDDSIGAVIFFENTGLRLTLTRAEAFAEFTRRARVGMKLEL